MRISDWSSDVCSSDLAAPGEDEPRLAGEAPQVYVRRTAREKALRARNWLAAHNGQTVHGLTLNANTPVLSADTTVILDNDVLGKPDDVSHARRLLARLSGRVHAVHTRAEEHTSELQSLMRISYAVFRLKK